MQLTLDQTMLIFQRAIDKSAGAGEGAAWWANVQAELEAVIAAATTAAAAGVIAWRHQVWKDLGDTPVRVTKILSVLSSAARVADLHMQIEAQRASGDRSVPSIRMVGMSTDIEGVEKLGTKLLVLGFALQIAGAIATGLSFIVQ